MNRDARLFLAGMADAGFWERISAFFWLGVSADARRKQRQYLRVKRMFEVALAEPDQVGEVEIRCFVRTRNWRPWLLLAVLTTVGIFEWSSYTVPALSGWGGMILHKCGLR